MVMVPRPPFYSVVMASTLNSVTRRCLGVRVTPRCFPHVCGRQRCVSHPLRERLVTVQVTISEFEEKVASLRKTSDSLQEQVRRLTSSITGVFLDCHCTPKPASASIILSNLTSWAPCLVVVMHPLATEALTFEHCQDCSV